jgi:hypothetical protein
MGCACFTGYGTTGIANLSLLCEISTVFLNYRSMVSKELQNAPIPMVNQVVFLITFILTRVIMLPYLLILQIIMLDNLWDYLSPFRRFTGVTCAVMSVLMLIINAYWFKLILKGFYKLLVAKGIIKEKESFK